MRDGHKWLDVKGQRINRFKVFRFVWLGLWILAAIFTVVSAKATPSFDTSNPECFFTKVASRLLSSELNVDFTHIQIYPTNEYTPAVHRLLQVTANIYDATTTNFYPTVFRPTFWVTNEAGCTNVYINGYEQIPDIYGFIIGTNHIIAPTLGAPVDIEVLAANDAGYVTNQNVYGIPWIIGAKKGLPGLNQFSMVNAAQFTRKLQVARNYVGGPIWTNQMYVMSITNNLGISFWNSYTNDYPTNYAGALNLSIYVSDTVQMALTNSDWGSGAFYTNFTTVFILNTNRWPGAQWYPNEISGQPAPNSFIAFNWANTFIPQLIYKIGAKVFAPATDSDAWETNNHTIFPLPQFGLATTNWVQAIIIDNTNVIDYVQLRGPTDSTNLTTALADFNYPSALNPGYLFQWSTNQSPYGVAWGVVNQITVSKTGQNLPVASSWRKPPNYPSTIPDSGPQDEAQFFNGILYPNSAFIVNGVMYTNFELAVQAPYTPSRMIYGSYLYQVNDPLVHYQASDLDAGKGANWAGNIVHENGVWIQDDNTTGTPIPTPPGANEILKSRYQPWGKAAPNSLLTENYNFGNAYNLIYKDPLVWGSDYWNFPTGQTWSLSWLGQVHRGTPWQTIYLKADNVLHIIYSGGGVNSGTNTWMAWSGDYNMADAALSAPINDRKLVSDLAALLNTNDLTTQFSVNNPDPNAWASLLDGMVVLTNSTLDLVIKYGLPELDPLVVSSNSPQAMAIANAIESTRPYYSIGDVLYALQLTEQSPYLNWNDSVQQQKGISDAAYEAIPSQLLPLLRADSFGAMVATNGQTQVQFSGYDGHAYAVQVSSDLINWISLSTNCPVNGMFKFSISASGNTGQQFYRSLLLK